MAFCNSCGATLSDGAQFCNKCGATTDSPSSAASAGSPTLPPPGASKTGGGGSALKIVLIIVGVVVLLGVLAVASVGFFAYRIAKHAKVSRDKVTVETPFGTVETNKDPKQVAKDLGVDIYPGVTLQTDGSASTTFGGIHTVAANFESDDSVDKVCAFYKSKFPNAMSTSATQDHCTIVSNSPPNMVTINIQSHGEGSKLQITNVLTKGTSPN